MKSEIFMILGGLAIFAIVLSLFIQMQAGQSAKKNSDSNGLTILGENDEGTPEPEPTTATPPPMTIDTQQDYKAVLQTSEGEITIDLHEEDTPITVNNFVYLARTGFYDNTTFHRVIEGFMIQGGDPKGTGAGGPGYKFDDEPFEGEYTRGTVAMANSGSNTNGSQFFIMHEDTTTLPKDYVIFGTVTEGMEVVDAIATAEVTTNSLGTERSKPVNPVKVTKVTISELEKIEEAVEPTEEPSPTPEATPGEGEETPTPTHTPTP